MIKQAIILRENDLFYENGYYKIESEMLFSLQNTIKVLYHIYNANLALLDKLNKNMVLNNRARFGKPTIGIDDLLLKRIYRS
jgi:hypothetical protein